MRKFLLRRRTWIAGLLMAATWCPMSQAATIQTLYSGTTPLSELAAAPDGSFYGTTVYGGTKDLGTVFHLTAGGNFQAIYSFTNTGDGANPGAGLFFGMDGNLYGTAQYGGTKNAGSVFTVTTNGSFTTLHLFNSSTEGAEPVAGLVEGTNNVYFGTANRGGVNGFGSIFSVTSTGTFNLLHSFTGADGDNPAAALVMGADGAFYGTTQAGGTGNFGTVFKIDTAGNFTSLFSFGGTNGAMPHSALVQEASGVLYGTTAYGGTSSFGSIFKITTNGAFTSLNSVTQESAGSVPSGKLLLGTDGNLYGCADYGGNNGFGAVFFSTLSGGVTSYYSFTGNNDGAYPLVGLVLSSNTLFGTTSVGGNSGGGTVFSFSLPQPFSITTQPASATNADTTPATFSVTAAGVAPLTYQWLFNGVNLTDSGHVSGSTNNLLTINDVLSPDAGSYSVVVSNVSGVLTSAVVTLTVVPVLITAQPASETNQVGRTAEFSVSALGAGPFTYQWLINGTNLPPEITTVAGNGKKGYTGNAGTATSAMLYNPYAVQPDPAGNFYIADRNNHVIRKVDTNDIITTVAGNGTNGYSGDSGAATHAMLEAPVSLALDAAGNLYIDDYVNNRIRKMDTNGIITTVAGNGTNGYSGDGGTATNAKLHTPSAVGLDAFGNFYIADTGNNRVRKVDTNGIITTVAGGTSRTLGDGGLAIHANLNTPSGIALDAAGNLYIADTGNNRIRKVATNGIIITVAGDGVAGYSGDGAAATIAKLHSPKTVTTDNSGDLYIGDAVSAVVRKVDANGLISTVAGTGTNGYSGDNGLPAYAKLNQPEGVAVSKSGNIFIADANNNRIRKISYFDEPSLVLTGTALTNAGNYSVIISNSYGSVTSSVAILDVLTDPFITTQPADATAINTSNATFSVTAIGTSPTYQWYWGALSHGHKIAGETNATATVLVPSVAVTNIFVVVKNAYNSVTSTVATLTIRLIPRIVKEPKNFSLVAGNNAALSLEAIGTAPLSYQWNFNGAPINGATTTSYNLVNVQSANAGSYSCTVTNITGVPVTTTNTAGKLAVKPDTNAPTVTLSAPKANAKLTNGIAYGGGLIAPTFTLAGVAKDKGLVTNIMIQQTFPTSQSFPFNATTNELAPGDVTFSNIFTLANGTNIYNVWAVNSGGVSSKTNEITLFYLNDSLLTINTTGGTGAGSVTNVTAPSPIYGTAMSGQQIALARNYTVKAIPGSNPIFTNWTDVNGNVLTNNVEFTFMMTPNLVLNANFLTNPVVAAGVAGSYNGLFYNTTEITAESSGFLGSCVVKSNRTFSGTLKIGGFSYSLSGTFDMNGNATNTVSRAAHRQNALTVAMNLDWTFGTKQITGTVTDSVDAWGANLTADLATNMLPVGAGKFTMAIPPGPGSPANAPGGYGYASITNNESGTVTFAGALADGTKFSASEPLSKDGVAPLYATPYSNNGLLIGWIDFSNSVPAGTVTWIKPATNTPATYPEGFANTVDVTGSAYSPSTPAMELTSGRLTITDADVAGLPLVFNVAVRNDNTIDKLLGSPTNKFSGSIIANTGVLTITFRPTGLGAISDKTATGVVLQSGTNALGAFTGTTNTGSIDMH